MASFAWVLWDPATISQISPDQKPSAWVGSGKFHERRPRCPIPCIPQHCFFTVSSCMFPASLNTCHCLGCEDVASLTKQRHHFLICIHVDRHIILGSGTWEDIRRDGKMMWKHASTIFQMRKEVARFTALLHIEPWLNLTGKQLVL